MLLNQLRQRTASVHDDLHKAPLLKKIIDKQATSTEYAMVLNAFLSYYKHFDAFFSEYQLPLVNYSEIFTKYLISDLHQLNVEPTQYHCPIGRALKDNVSSYIGYSYVTVGSMKGAKTIFCMLQKNKKIDKSATLFFSKCSEHQEQSWQEFLSALESLRRILIEEQVMESAQQSFHAILAYIQSAETESCCRSVGRLGL